MYFKRGFRRSILKKKIDLNSLRYLKLYNLRLSVVIILSTTTLLFYFNIPLSEIISNTGFSILNTFYIKFANLFNLPKEFNLLNILKYKNIYKN